MCDGTPYTDAWTSTPVGTSSPYLGGSYGFEGLLCLQLKRWRLVRLISFGWRGHSWARVLISVAECIWQSGVLGDRRISPEDPLPVHDLLLGFLRPAGGEGGHPLGEGPVNSRIFLQVACGPVGHQVVSGEAAGGTKDWLLFLDSECQS